MIDRARLCRYTGCGETPMLASAASMFSCRADAGGRLRIDAGAIIAVVCLK